jgi:hypothetical protein
MANKVRKTASRGKKLRRKEMKSIRPLKAPLIKPSPGGPVPVPYPNVS